MIDAVAPVYPEALASSLTLPSELLHAAAQMSRTRRGPAMESRFSLASLDGRSTVSLQSGLRLSLDQSFSSVQNCDLLILPAIWRHPRRALQQMQPWLARLRQLHERGCIICSVGTASAVLAEAGLLDHRAATTHWRDFDRFERSYPRVDLKRRHLITRSERIYCVGSVNSIADFMVHQIGEWYGDRIARSVEAQFSPEARQSFETAAFLEESPGAHHDALIRDAQDHMQQHPAEPHSVEVLASFTGLSPRSFGRRFRKATGETPIAYLQGVRIREARGLLQHTDLGMADIAWRCGFSSPSRFSQAFKKSTDMSPRHFRQVVRGKRFSAGP